MKESAIRMLALALFASCAVSAFCLAMLAYTFVTGDLPFGLTPIMSMPDVRQAQALAAARKKDAKKKDKETVFIEGPGTVARANEKFLASFYEELRQEKEKIAEEKKNLAVRQKVVEELKEEALKIQAEVEKIEDRVKKTLVTIDKKEIDNIKKIMGLMSGMEIAEATNMLLGMEEGMATRVLYFMNAKKASELITQGMKTGDDKQKEKLKRMTEKLQTLTSAEEKKNE